MSDSYTGKIDRVELADRGPSLVVMVQTDPDSEYEGKRFRAWATVKDSDEKTPIWKSLEEFNEAATTITIDYHIDTFNGKNGPISKNMIDNVKMAEPQGDWSGLPAEKTPVAGGGKLSKEEGELLKKALVTTVDEFVEGA